MNRIQLLGRLGCNPEGGEGLTGPYASFSVATSERWVDRLTGEPREHTQWHRLVCFDRLAEISLEFLVKGSEIYAEGRPRLVRRPSKGRGSPRGLEVWVDELRMLRRAPSAEPARRVASGLASVEVLLREVAAGRRQDASLLEIAGMVGVLRSTLVGEGEVPA